MCDVTSNLGRHEHVHWNINAQRFEQGDEMSRIQRYSSFVLVKLIDCIQRLSLKAQSVSKGIFPRRVLQAYISVTLWT